MTVLDLDAIEARSAHFAALTVKDGLQGATERVTASVADVPPLLAEVRRLQMALADEQRRNGTATLREVLRRLHPQMPPDSAAIRLLVMEALR